MKDIVLRAKIILSKMFRLSINHFETHTSRQVKVVEMRRFLTYFLRDEYEMTYKEICRHIPSIRNHATCIHHYKTLKHYLTVEPRTQKWYRSFVSLMLESPLHLVENKLMDKIEERKKINKDINQLKKLLK